MPDMLRVDPLVGIMCQLRATIILGFGYPVILVECNTEGIAT